MSNITTINDSIESPGDNVIEGNADNNVLVGTDGDDRLIGYVGIDTLTGGDGNDVFVLGDENGSFYNTKEWQDFATITDFIVGEDSILLPGTSADYSFTQHESGQAWIFDNGDFVAAVDNTAVQDVTSSLVFLGGEPPTEQPTEPPTEPPPTEPPPTEPPTSNGVIEGNADNNVLDGTDGDDRLIGYVGIDTLTGGDGNDVFVLGDENGSFYNTKEWQDFATITDFTVGEDSILLTGTLADYSFTQHESGQAWIFDNGDFAAAVNNTTVPDLTSGLVFLGGEPPTTEPPATEPPTTEPPTTEPPTTEPPTEDGVIEGSANNDDLVGTNGDDRLIGYVGIDTLTGGDGNDVFVLGDENGSFYNTKEWQDFATITDFTVGEDSILLTGTLADYSFTQHGSGQAWIFDNGDFVAAVDDTTVEDVTSSLVFLGGEPPTTEPPTTEPPTTEPPTTEPPTTEPPTEDGVIEGSANNDDLVGTDGDDRLIGYTGIDTLTGGDGNDVFVLGDENGSFYNVYEWQDFATITDFTVGEDSILLTGTLADYSFTQHESGQAWIFDNGDFVAAVDNTTVEDVTSSLVFLGGEPPTTEPPTTEPPTTEPPTTEPPTTEPPNIPPPTLEGVIEITAIGDSITQAGTGFNSYRNDLWHMLTGAGYDVDFVGSQNATNDGSPFPDSSFDPDHEGHWGWRTDEINNGRGSEGSLSDWLTGYTPDIALIHLGTNDLFHLQSAESTINELRETIEILRADKPNVVVFLAQLIPTTDSGRNARIDEFNAQIPALVAEVNQTNSPVILVDQNSGFNANQDTFDGIHPTAAGEAKMAQNWFDAINSYLTSNGITPEPGTEPPTTEPPTTEPPTTEPPTTEPPTTEPPTTEPPADGVIEGDANNNNLVGTDGDDRLIGYTGIDDLTGGDGHDVFVLGDENGSFYDAKEWQDFAKITDFTVGEDTILLAGTSADYTFSTEGHQTWIFNNGDFVATLQYTAGQDVTNSLEFLGGEAPSPEPPITEPPETEPPVTEPPITKPPAPHGFNIIEGNSDNNILVGTDGNDQLIGYVGIDDLTGGDGNDVFVLGDENGSFYSEKEWQDFAKITDFTVGEDTILVTGSRDDHSFVTEGHQTWIFNNGDFIATLHHTAGQDIASSLAFLG